MVRIKQKAEAGFTLIETLVALSVLLAAIVGPVSLISRGLLNTASAKNKLVALGLAQEGIELVRLVRENNVLCDALNGATTWQWDEDPALPNPTPGSPNPRNQIPNFVRMDVVSFNATDVNCKSAAVSPAIILPTPRTPSDASPPVLRLETSSASPNFGLYQYSSGTNTNFRRTLEVRSPPIGAPDPGINPQFQMDITSTVTWTERGAPKSVTLQERLFDWR